MPLLDTIFSFVDGALCVVGTILNSILTCLIMFKSPHSIASYRYLMMNGSVSDLLTCLLTLFVQPRILTFEDNFLYVANGICKFIGKNSCVISYAWMIMMYAHLNWSQLASFAYRWYVLHRNPPTKRTMILFIVGIATPTLLILTVAGLSYFTSYLDADFSSNVTAVHPEMDVTGLTIFGAPHAITELRAVIFTAWVLWPIFPITIIVFFIRWRILKYLSRQHILSENTKKLHRTFLKVLTLQAMLPPIYLLTSAFFMTGIVMQYHNLWFEYAVFAYLWIPLLSPLFPLYFITSYRRYLLQLIGKKPKKVNPATYTHGKGCISSSNGHIEKVATGSVLHTESEV